MKVGEGVKAQKSRRGNGNEGYYRRGGTSLHLFAFKLFLLIMSVRIARVIVASQLLSKRPGNNVKLLRLSRRHNLEVNIPLNAIPKSQQLFC